MKCSSPAPISKCYLEEDNSGTEKGVDKIVVFLTMPLPLQKDVAATSSPGDRALRGAGIHPS